MIQHLKKTKKTSSFELLCTKDRSRENDSAQSQASKHLTQNLMKHFSSQSDGKYGPESIDILKR